MYSYSIFLLIFGVTPLIECARTTGKISTSVNTTTAIIEGFAKNNYISTGMISFEEFKLKFNKTYATEAEEQKRLRIFQRNVKIIKENNKLFDLGKASNMMAVTIIADMKLGEIVSNPNGFIKSSAAREHMKSTLTYKPIDLGKEPSSLDLRRYDNPIREQIGSTCYVFAAVASMESAIAMKYGELQQLSEQYLIDCDGRNGGCKGGFPSVSIEYVMENGIALRSGYPFTGNEGTCDQQTPKTKYAITRMHEISSGRDDELLNALVHIGPIAVGIYASSAIMNYAGGVLENACGGNTPPNHAVVLVGYGTSSDGKPYWLLRNSWGRYWGPEGGYFRFSRATVNHCKISSQAVVPSGADKILNPTVLLAFSSLFCIIINKIRTD